METETIVILIALLIFSILVALAVKGLVGF